MEKKIFSYSDHMPSSNGFFKKKVNIFNAYDKKILLKKTIFQIPDMNIKKIYLILLSKVIQKKCTV